jgi:hypothetical protein
LQSYLPDEFLAIDYRGSASKISLARENINGNFPRRSVKLRPSNRFDCLLFPEHVRTGTKGLRQGSPAKRPNAPLRRLPVKRVSANKLLSSRALVVEFAREDGASHPAKEGH